MPFDLSEEAHQRSGVGLVLDAGGEWSPRLGAGKRLRLGLNVQRREYTGSDFDDMTLAIYAGPRIVSGRWDLSLLGSAYLRWYGARPYNQAFGGRVEATYHPGPRVEISAVLSAQSVTYQRLPLVFSVKGPSNGRLTFENMFELKWASDDIQRHTAHIVVCLSSNLNAGDQR